jgi:hypothetical protein
VPTESIAPTESPTAECASLRSKKNFGPICDRVGCYESPRTSPQCGVAYCSHECRDAVRRVRDRERKYLWRRTSAGRLKSELTARRRRLDRQSVAAASRSDCPAEPVIPRAPGVHPYRAPPESAVGYGDRKEVSCHDIKNSEAPTASQSRPPPT